MISTLLAAVGWVAACWVPGYLVANALRSRAEPLRNAALAPVIALGLTMLVAQVLQAAGIPVRPATVLPVSIGLPVVLWLFVRARRGVPVRKAVTAGGRTRASIALLTAGIGAGLCLWLVTIPSTSAVLPNDDGTHHALYASRILTLRTIDPGTVLAGDLATRSPTDRYYPLALHVTSAMISGVTGVAVNTVLTVGFVLAAAAALPLGMYVLARRVLPDRPAVAGLAALISATLPWFPFSPIVWGGVALIVGMAFVPAVLDASCRPDRDAGVVGGGVLLGLTWYGLFTTHNSEIVTVALFLAVFAVVGRTYRQPRLLAHWGSGFAAMTIVLAPQIPALIAGASERSDAQGTGPTGALSAGLLILGAGNFLVLPIALYGLVIALCSRLCIECAWTLPAIALLCLAASGALGPLRSLTTPYYSSAVRISFTFVYVEAIFAALGLAALGTAVRGRLSRPDGRSHVALMWAGTATVVAMAGLNVSGATALVSTAYRGNSLVGADQRAAFAWLAGHVTAGSRVLNQFDDGSGWLSTLDDVTPVFATKANAPYPDPSVAWGDRWYLLTHASDLATDPRARAVVRRWNVQYVYVDAHHFGLQQPELSATALAASPEYHLVWRRGSVTIFAVDPSITAAAGVPGNDPAGAAAARPRTR